MKVDSKLLEKYYSGFCTNLEQTIVEEWLTASSFDDNEVLELPKNESKILHKEKMWVDISKVLGKPTVKVIPLYKTVMRYVAACIIVCITIFGTRVIDYSLIMEEEFAFVNTDDTMKKTNINGLELGLTSKSSLNATSTIFHQTKEIAVCGNMIIKNTTKSNIKIKIHSTCNINDSKEVVLRKGKNYYVFTSKVNNEEKLQIMNQNKVRNLLPRELRKLKTIFKV